MVGSGKDGLAEIQFTDVHEFSFTPGFPYVNILRKWWYIWLASFKSLLSHIKTTIYQYNPPKVCFLFLCWLPSQRSPSSSEWTGVCEGGWGNACSILFFLSGLLFSSWVAYKMIKGEKPGHCSELFWSVWRKQAWWRSDWKSLSLQAWKVKHITRFLQIHLNKTIRS